ncbi:hypothetical protein FOL47_001005 [Perkinsus chesapeaki]|uniref:L-type lectin-like domain-containing protein n=1 Tax=Perkinsus chesapeaki TaxID=330153 RepID=A0A7J6KTW0_PERCH|nr:hypothetical protein FOL47_001005 [Perkinsus chesapeaki]
MSYRIPASGGMFVFGLLFSAVFGEVREVEFHSFTQEMDFHKFTSRWDSIGTCLPEHNHIVLSPRAADRYGALWNKFPLHTNDFEVEFTILSEAPRQGGDPAHEEGFAFWYVYDNASSGYDDLVKITEGTTDKLKDMGMGMMGYKNNFDGVGVFFANNKFSESGEMVLKPSASIIINDGGQRFDRQRDLPSGHGSYWSFRNTKLKVRIRMQPNDVLVEAKAENQGWVKLIEHKIDNDRLRLKPGGYIGLTSMVGNSPNQPSFRADLIGIQDLHVRNHDNSMIGGAPKVEFKPYRPVQHIDFLEENNGGGSSQGTVINDLVRAVYSVITGLEPMNSMGERTIKELQAKLDTLHQEMTDLKEAVESIGGGNMAEQYQTLRNELVQVSRETMRSNFEKRRSLEELSEHAQKIGSLGDVSGKIKNKLASQGNTLFYLAVASLVAVLVVGSGVYAKFRRLEKKHML